METLKVQSDPFAATALLRCPKCKRQFRQQDDESESQMCPVCNSLGHEEIKADEEKGSAPKGDSVPVVPIDTPELVDRHQDNSTPAPAVAKPKPSRKVPLGSFRLCIRCGKQIYIRHERIFTGGDLICGDCARAVSKPTEKTLAPEPKPEDKEPPAHRHPLSQNHGAQPKRLPRVVPIGRPRTGEIRQCDKCGKEIYVKKCRLRQRIRCRPCYLAVRKPPVPTPAKKPRAGEQRECERCGKSFWAWRYSIKKGQGRFCCIPCAHGR